MLPEGLWFTGQSKRGVRFGSHSAACPRPALALQAETCSFGSLMPWRAFSPKPAVQPGLSANTAELHSALLNFMEIGTIRLLGAALLLPLLKPVDSAAFRASLQERLSFVERVKELSTWRSWCHPGHGLEFGTGREGGVTRGWQ